MDEVFLRFSAPEPLHSDQGRHFKSQLLSEVCKLMHINKTRTTPYHPHSDGFVERFNWTMLAMLVTCAKDNPLDWEKHMRKVEYKCSGFNWLHPIFSHVWPTSQDASKCYAWCANFQYTIGKWVCSYTTQATRQCIFSRTEPHSFKSP